MTIIYKDRCQETSTTTGTGDFALAAAQDGYRRFSAAFAINDEIPYAIQLIGGTDWEVGIGRYSAANTLQRSTVLASSNAGALVNFAAGDKIVMCTLPADRIPFRNVTSDPSAPVPGETWFNLTTNIFKGAVSGTAAWAASTALGNPKQSAGGAGTNSAGVLFGGFGTPSTYYTSTDTLNGTTWSGQGPLASARAFVGAWGTQSSAVCAGGAGSGGTAQNTTYLFSGTGWSTSAAMTGARKNVAGFGASSTSGTIVGGYDGTNLLLAGLNWNGTAWSTGVSLASTRHVFAGCGTATAAIVGGGSAVIAETDALNTAYTYNGTAYTATGNFNVPRTGCGAFGDPSDAMFCGGFDGTNYLVSTERFNGLTFATGIVSGVARRHPGFFGNSARTGMMCGGFNGVTNPLNTTEKFTHPVFATRTFTIA